MNEGNILPAVVPVTVGTRIRYPVVKPRAVVLEGGPLKPGAAYDFDIADQELEPVEFDVNDEIACARWAVEKLGLTDEDLFKVAADGRRLGQTFTVYVNAKRRVAGIGVTYPAVLESLRAG